MDFLDWFDDIDQIRVACACLVNGDASDIAFVASSSAGMPFLMHGLNRRPGDEVLRLEDGFPNHTLQRGWIATACGSAQRPGHASTNR
jgi:hypothetical protein